jgi:BMFP domain-containing protein YqiC
MTQTTGKFFDELGKLITDAAGAAQGVRKEIESVVRAQAKTSCASSTSFSAKSSKR